MKNCRQFVNFLSAIDSNGSHKLDINPRLVLVAIHYHFLNKIDHTWEMAQRQSKEYNPTNASANMHF